MLYYNNDTNTTTPKNKHIKILYTYKRSITYLSPRAGFAVGDGGGGAILFFKVRPTPQTFFEFKVSFKKIIYYVISKMSKWI